MKVGTGSRLWITGVLLSGLVLGSAAPALAHNQLIGSDPADEASVEQGPAEVQLTFLASLDPDGAELAVTGPDGASAVAGEPDFDGAVVTIPVDAPLAGEYEIAYNVLSDDGHWADGTVTFTVSEGEPPPGPSPTPTAESPPPEPPATPSPTPDPVATGDESGSDGLAWWAWLVIALVFAAAGYGGYLVYRRRDHVTGPGAGA